MARTKPRKRQLVKKHAAANTNTTNTAAVSPKIEKKIMKNKKKKIKRPRAESPDSDSDSDPQTKIQTLLEPFSKDQLVALVTDLSVSHSSLYPLIKSAADQDISHRKFFIHGLGWDTTRQSMEPIFGAYGEIEELNVVNDRATGQCKGYAFITYKTRRSAKKLLKNPKVQVGNRTASCQLAAEGTVTSSHQHFPASDYSQRKIYVSNVPVNVSVDRLKTFFEQFGEIESGPKGFDPMTGRFKGYTILVYKTVEAAKKVLEDPYKMYDGSQLHCQKATEGKTSKVAGGAASITTALQPVKTQMLAAAQQAQTMALMGQQLQAGMVNPLYYGGGMIPNPNLGAVMGGYYGMMGGGQMQGLGLGSFGGSAGGQMQGMGLGSYGGSGGAQVQGLGLGSYGGSGGGQVQGLGLGSFGGSGGGQAQGLGLGSYGGSGGGGEGGAMLQGLQYMYPSGQSSSFMAAKAPVNNNIEGYSPMCFSMFLQRKDSGDG